MDTEVAGTSSGCWMLDVDLGGHSKCDIFFLNVWMLYYCNNMLLQPILIGFLCSVSCLIIWLI